MGERVVGEREEEVEGHLSGGTACIWTPGACCAMAKERRGKREGKRGAVRCGHSGGRIALIRSFSLCLRRPAPIRRSLRPIILFTCNRLRFSRMTVLISSSSALLQDATAGPEAARIKTKEPQKQNGGLRGPGRQKTKEILVKEASLQRGRHAEGRMRFAPHLFWFSMLLPPPRTSREKSGP